MSLSKSPSPRLVAGTWPSRAAAMIRSVERVPMRALWKAGTTTEENGNED